MYTRGQEQFGGKPARWQVKWITLVKGGSKSLKVMKCLMHSQLQVTLGRAICYGHVIELFPFGSCTTSNIGASFSLYAYSEMRHWHMNNCNTFHLFYSYLNCMHICNFMMKLGNCLNLFLFERWSAEVKHPKGNVKKACNIFFYHSKLCIQFTKPQRQALLFRFDTVSVFILYIVSLTIRAVHRLHTLHTIYISTIEFIQYDYSSKF